MEERTRGIVLVFMLLLSAPASLSAQDIQPPSNLDQIRKISAGLADKIIADGSFAPQDTVSFNPGTADASEIIGQVFLQAMMTRKLNPTLSRTDSLLRMPALTLGILACTVRYSSSFDGGLFGDAMTERSVLVTLTARKSDAGGTVRLSKEYSQELRDTVGTAMIAGLENSSYPFTHGAAPGGRFLDSLLAPLIIIGSLGLAVYLLFSVRS